MKLASLKANGRDGQLVIVSRDLKIAILATDIAPTLQNAIENWASVEPALKERYDDLNANGAAGKNGVFAFDETVVASPLPRAYQWLDGSAYLSHVELVRKSRGADMPKSMLEDPLMYQGSSDNFCGPHDPVYVASEDWGTDLEAEIAVITDNVPMLTTPQEAVSHIKLFMLLNDISLRNLIPTELNKGFGFLNGKGVTAFSPVAVTPDELGDAWDGQKINLDLTVHVNGEKLGSPNAATDVYFTLAQLISHAARTRNLGAGTVVGTGTISNHNHETGFCCISEKRALETIRTGAPVTSFFKFGDQVRIEMFDAKGQSIFGSINNEIKQYVK